MNSRFATAFRNATSAAIVTVLAASCHPQTPGASSAEHGALPTMERVMKGANACWFKAGDPAFASYQLAPELNSYTGRPRILVVERRNPSGRPLLVVQAEGSPAKMDAFGPMMDGAQAARITRDVTRWGSGSSGC
jgi:hypothetical protein